MSSKNIETQPAFPNKIVNETKNLNKIVHTSNTSSKKTLWRVVYVAVTIVTCVLLKKIYLFQTMSEFDYLRKGTILDLLIYSVPFAIVFGIIDQGIHRFADQWVLDHYISLEKFPDLEVRKNRSYTLAKWGFSLLYYLPISIWGYFILQKTSFMPAFLGGNGSCINLENYIYTFDEANGAMKAYYLIQFGKHLSRFFSHVFIRSEGNFYEYALHHALSTFLIFFSFLANMWLVGIFVLLIHDVSDIFLSFARGYREYRHRNEYLFNVASFCTIISWIFCRICMLSYCCVYSSASAAYKNYDILPEPFYSTLLFPYLFMSFMLGALEVLQLFWTYYVGMSFLSIGVTTKVKHTYD